MKKSTLIMILSLIMAVAVGMGSTVAYLQDTDEDVNVMTLGKVTITQNEQEYNEAGELVEFTQDKPLYPAVGTPAWDVTADSTEEEKAWRQFTGMENVVDKYVTVTNTGKSDAYVRTLVALEMGELSFQDLAAVLGLSTNYVDGAEFDFPGAWECVKDDVYAIGGKNYNVMVFEHQDAVKPGETTIPSLLQLYLKGETTTNDTMDKIDGNGNGKYDVLVLSQAVQTMGFETANTALTTAFGEINAENVGKWFANIGDNIGSPGDKWVDNNPPVTDAIYVTNLEEFKAALAEGGYIVLSEDITMDNMIKIEDGVEVILNMNGKTINFERNSSFKPGNPLFYPLTGSKLVFTGNGTVDLEDNFDTALVCPAGEVVIENGTYIKDRAPEGMSDEDVQTLFIGVKSVGASVVIKDGYFDGGYYDKNADAAFVETEADVTNRGKAADKNAYRMAIKNNVSLLINLSWSSAAGTQDFRIYGGTFVGANPAWGDEGCAMPITPDYLRPWSYYQGMFLEGQQMYDDKIEIPAGYTITEGTTEDNRPTFTVKYAE
ncbi:MAG: hypothetical protein IJB81_06010 [Clostridia bacterium]|nr:hypothetical protein [Clostridia bacterium]